MNKNTDNKKFYVIGLNYKKADVVTRSNFSLSKEKQEELLLEAKKINIKSFFPLVTGSKLLALQIIPFN